MEISQIIGRILHIGFGVFWAGTIFFYVFLLEPSIRSLGSDGGKIMQALIKRRFLTVVPVAAAITILSGADLYWRVSGGMSSAWMGTAYGQALSTGAVAALMAFVIGVFFMRPAALRIGKLAAGLDDVTDDDERDGITAQIDSLKKRSRGFAHSVAFLLIVSVVTMAMARHL